jgi:hypothetical protein
MIQKIYIIQDIYNKLRIIKHTVNSDNILFMYKYIY